MKRFTGQSRMLWIVIGAALALRLFHLWAMRVNPLFDQPIMDAAVHDAWARGLLAGTWPGPEPFFRAPLYIYFLAGLYALFDAARFPVQLVHALVSSLAAGLAALSADRLWGRRAGYMAGGLLAALWTHIYFSAELLIVTLIVSLNLLWLWLLLREEAPPSPWRLLLAGLVLGLSAVARPNILIVVPVVAWYAWRGLRTRPAGWLLLAAGLALPILPVTVSNLVRGGDAVLIASQGGVNFYIGNNPASDGRTAIVPGTRPTWQGGYDDAVALAERAEGRTLKASEVDRHYLGRGLDFWADNPGAALGLYGHKLRMLLGAGERSNNKFIYAWREWSPLLKVPVLAGWPALLCLAVLGWSRRDGNAPARMLLLVTAAAYALSILLFFVNARFRLPVAAILAIPAGAGLDALWTALRRRRWELGWIGPLLAVGLLAYSLSDFRDFREHRTEANPFYRYTLGNAYLTRGETGPAIAAYREALAIQARTPNREFGLVRDNLYDAFGDALLREGRTGEALQATRRWVEANPNARAARLKLGDLLLGAGRVDEAEVQFEIVLRTDPDDAAAMLGSAWVAFHREDHGRALRRFETLHRRRPDASARFGAGMCLMALGRDTEAVRAFEEVLRLAPAYWQALGNLAEIHQRAGRLEQASDAYRRLLRINPADKRARAWLQTH